jgi:putative transposase
MPSHSFHQLFYHIVWATKDRLRLIEDDVKQILIEAVCEACRKRGVESIACNAMPDHVHLLVRLRPTIEVANFIGQIKGASAHAHNHRFGARNFLKWQDGYGVVSLRGADVEKVVRYIADQQQIHESRKISRLLETMQSELEE